MNYLKLRTRATQFESITGLKVEEFDYLLTSFSARWRNFYKVHTIEGKKRKAPILNPDKPTTTLPSVEEKLFFILVYLKNHGLQEMIGASFDFTQSQTSKWQKVLLPLLREALGELQVLPVRSGHQIAQVLKELEAGKCFQDASERLINRPGDKDTQQEFYSGKKKPIL